MKKLLIKLILCFIIFFQTNLLANSNFIKKIDVKVLNKTDVKITIILNKPASIILYYDNQRPADTNMLKAFWYFKTFSLISVKHQIVLKKLNPMQEYYFRISARMPYRDLSDVLSWKMILNKDSIITGK